jgi:hypothetical protein
VSFSDAENPTTLIWNMRFHECDTKASGAFLTYRPTAPIAINRFEPGGTPRALGDDGYSVTAASAA